VRSYRADTQSSHMANGRFWLIPLGIGGPILRTLAAFRASSTGLSNRRSFPMHVAAGLGIAHALSTVKAARINWAVAPLAAARVQDCRRSWASGH
jgi:hypothetical protein